MIKSIEKQIKFYEGIMYILMGIICGLIITTFILEYITRNTNVYFLMVIVISLVIIIARYFAVKEALLKKRLKEEKKKMYIRPSLINEEIGL